ncbi:MAG: sigma-70 family RNA polymerase sigma factor [Synechococcaceae cyanobacterium MAG-AL2]|uniref:sigma-70 family RNA polymerase sigma factor n=1 Tax=Candidatus Regnicoccus frigidus TaxID=3074015 RepID=UPI002825C45C|nr:sigma-70 family RNA polymerase sigma factor [Candidatus Regnicoccus frigidus]MCT4367049.1 sigma-70 family RNA polymerase sigma factor [Candidatus Regnicoccus frigidus MAG-AL2]
MPIPSFEEQLIHGRAIRAWQDWPPSPADAPLRVKRSGLRSREQMVARNMRLVVTCSRSFNVAGIISLDVADLIQEGSIGLARAVEKFDPMRGYKFSTYAVPWIRQSMIRLIHSANGIRVPVKRSERMHQLRQWRERFQLEHGRPATDVEAMAGMDLSPADLQTLALAAACHRQASLDVLINDDESESNTLLTAIQASSNNASTRRQQQLQAVSCALAPWPQQQEVMLRRLDGETFAEVARGMGLGLEQAKGLSRSGLINLRERLEGRESDQLGLFSTFRR